MKRWMPLIISMVIATLFVVIHLIIEMGLYQEGVLSRTGFLRGMDREALDFKFKSRQVHKFPSPEVVIAGIDEKSIERYGLWPWDRTVIADFIDVVTTGVPKGSERAPGKGARVIAFDAVFSDKNQSESFLGADVLRQTFEGGPLNPNAGEFSTIEGQLGKLVLQHQRAQRAVTQLSRELETNRSPGIAQALVSAQKSVVATTELLTRTRETLGELQNGSSVFLKQLIGTSQYSTPEHALAAAIGRSPKTILGYFCFFRTQDLIGVDRDKTQASISAVAPSSLNQIFVKERQDHGGTTVEFIKPLPGATIGDLDLAGQDLIAIRAPLPLLSEKATAFGHFNAAPDLDGPIRRLGLVYRHQDKLYPSLSLVAAARYFDSTLRPLYGEVLPNTLSGVDFGGPVVAPTTSSGELLLNYYGAPENYFPTYSIADIIDGTVSPDVYRDKVLLFGMTAIGLYDLRPNPFSPTTPGVFIHAVAIQNMLDGLFLQRFYGMAIYEAIAYLLLGLLLGLLLPKLPPWSGILVTLGVSGGFYLYDALVLFPSGNWLLSFFPALEAATIFLAVSVHGYLTEGREKRKIRNAFQFYLTKSVVDEVLLEPSKLRLGGEKRTCSVLFSDIRGFTTISERLDAEHLVALLNEYLTPMTNIVFKYDGTLDKYMGDAIMAIFGAPVAHANHPVLACRTALDMMSALKGLQAGWNERGLPALDIGIGINTGPMSVGNMGSEVRFDYTVMGDNVNLGSRLEGINKQYGTNIIISEYTYEAAKGEVYGRELDSVRVKGKREPVRIFELLGHGEPTEKEKKLIDYFAEGLSLYKEQRWDDAIDRFNRLREEVAPDDHTSRLYIRRCETMKENPPAEDWDGVFTMTTK